MLSNYLSALYEKNQKRTDLLEYIDMLKDKGQKVKLLVDEKLDTGYQVVWDGMYDSEKQID